MSKVGCIVLWMVVDTHGVAKLSLYWARLALAPRTGHTGVACRNMNAVVVMVMARVPVFVAVALASSVFGVVCTVSVFVARVTDGM